MALHISSTLSHQSWSPATPINYSSDNHARLSTRRLELGWNSPRSSTNNNGLAGINTKLVKNVRVKCGVKASLETTTTAADVDALVGKVTEVTKDSFWPIVNAAKDKTVVLDMYTQWCGPCKVMAPKFQELAEEKLDVIFLKLDCNQDNKPLAKELGIRVVPTFKILRHNKVVKEVTGAKFEELVKAIEIAEKS